MMLTYLRHPGRWDLDTFKAATLVPGIFDGLTPQDCAEVLDRIQTIRESVKAHIPPRK